VCDRPDGRRRTLGHKEGVRRKPGRVDPQAVGRTQARRRCAILVAGPGRKKPTVKILLVEDDPRLRSRLKDDLGRRGYASIPRTTASMRAPRHGVALRRGDPGPGPAAALRHEVLRNWRARGIAVPVLILTARDAWHEKVDGFKAGRMTMSPSPSTSKSVCPPGRPAAPRARPADGVVTAAGLTPRRTRQSVSAGGSEIGLSCRIPAARNFMLAPGEVCRRRQLADHIYDNDSSATARHRGSRQPPAQQAGGAVITTRSWPGLRLRVGGLMRSLLAPLFAVCLLSWPSSSACSGRSCRWRSTR